MPKNKLKRGEKIFLMAAMAVIVGTCAALLVLCGVHG